MNLFNVMEISSSTKFSISIFTSPLSSLPSDCFVLDFFLLFYFSTLRKRNKMQEISKCSRRIKYHKEKFSFLYCMLDIDLTKKGNNIFETWSSEKVGERSLKRIKVKLKRYMNHTTVIFSPRLWTSQCRCTLMDFQKVQTYLTVCKSIACSDSLSINGEYHFI